MNSDFVFSLEAVSRDAQSFRRLLHNYATDLPDEADERTAGRLQDIGLKLVGVINLASEFLNGSSNGRHPAKIGRSELQRLIHQEKDSIAEFLEQDSPEHVDSFIQEAGRRYNAIFNALPPIDESLEIVESLVASASEAMYLVKTAIDEGGQDVKAIISVSKGIPTMLRKAIKTADLAGELIPVGLTMVELVTTTREAFEAVVPEESAIDRLVFHRDPERG